MTTKPESKSISRNGPLRAVFLDHPQLIGETYFEHQRVALGFAGSLAITAAAAFLHALVPCLCENTARKRIGLLNARLQERAVEIQPPELRE